MTTSPTGVDDGTGAADRAREHQSVSGRHQQDRLAAAQSQFNFAAAAPHARLIALARRKVAITPNGDRNATGKSMRVVANTSTSVVGFTQTREHVNTHACPDRGPEEGPDDGRWTGLAALAAALWGREMAPPAWHERAACRNEDPALFEGGQGLTQRAKRICADCPVAELCAADQERFELRGAAHRRSISELSTVRGGLSAADRHRRHQARATSSKA